MLVGRNNKENDYLTLKTASKADIWFHTKDIPGSHVIVQTDGKELSESGIFEAAAIAAYHSKGRTSENVPVDYVAVRYVKTCRRKTWHGHIHQQQDSLGESRIARIIKRKNGF